jgi:hypothetical protein
LQLDAKTRLNFSIASILYIGGALGFELIGILILQQNEANNLIYRIVANIEESLEMAGSIFFIWGLLIYISDNFQQTKLQVIILFGESPSDKDI